MTPERETAHFAHGTGRRWLDLTLALSAMFVSIVSLVVASALALFSRWWLGRLNAWVEALLGRRRRAPIASAASPS